MTLSEATNFIRPGIQPANGTWADIGAGTGLFTMALMQIIKEGTIIAIDKSTHELYNIKSPPHLHFEIREDDFNQPLKLPAMDGILMANALHYANDHIVVLENVLASLREGGRFVLIEYDTEVPNVPWVPNPVSLKLFCNLCKQVGLSDPDLIGERQSIYQDGRMYAAVSKKTKT